MQASYAPGYGLGVQVKQTTTGRNIWHFGNWPGGNPPAPPTTPQQFSSYFALWDTGDLIIVLTDKQMTNSQQASLDAAMRKAIDIK